MQPQNAAPNQSVNSYPQSDQRVRGSFFSRHFLLFGIGFIFILFQVIPPSSAGMAIMAGAIGLICIVSAVRVFFDAWRSSSNKLPVIRIFSILGGIGLAVVILYVGFIAAMIGMAAKNPDPS